MLFAHGHVLRVLGARWIGLPPGGGQHFLLDTDTVCVLGYYGEIPAVSGTGLSSTRSHKGRLCAQSLDNKRAIHAAAKEQAY